MSRAARRAERTSRLNAAMSAFFQSNDLATAEREVDAAIAIDPNWDRAQTLRAQILLRQRRYSEALSSADIVLARRPTDSRAMGLRAQALLGLGRRDEALEQCDTQLRADPGNVVAMGLRTQALLAFAPARTQEAIDQAEAQVRAHLEAGREVPPVALMLRGLAYLTTGRLRAGRALADFNAILDRRPDDARAMGGRSLALMAIGGRHNADALRQTEALLARYPDDPYAPGLIGRALFRLGRFAEAIANAQRFPGDSAAGAYGARSLSRMGQADVAIAYFERAPPEDQAARWGIAEAHFTRGRFDLAHKTLAGLWADLLAREPNALHRWPIIGLLRIDIEGVLGVRSSEAERILALVASRHGAAAVEELVREARGLTWTYVVDEATSHAGHIAISSIYARGSVEFLRPVDGWTDRASR